MTECALGYALRFHRGQPQQVYKCIGHHNKQPDIGIIQISMDDAVYFFQSLVQGVPVDIEFLRGQNRISSAVQISPQCFQKICFILRIIYIKLHYTGMAQMSSVDPAGAVVHKIVQHIVLKIIAPLMRTIFFSHLKSSQSLFIIAGKSAEIKENITDAGVK